MSLANVLEHVRTRLNLIEGRGLPLNDTGNFVQYYSRLMLQIEQVQIATGCVLVTQV